MPSRLRSPRLLMIRTRIKSPTCISSTRHIPPAPPRLLADVSTFSGSKCYNGRAASFHFHLISSSLSTFPPYSLFTQSSHPKSFTNCRGKPCGHSITSPSPSVRRRGLLLPRSSRETVGKDNYDDALPYCGINLTPR